MLYSILLIRRRLYYWIILTFFARVIDCPSFYCTTIYVIPIFVVSTSLSISPCVNIIRAPFIIKYLPFLNNSVKKGVIILGDFLSRYFTHKAQRNCSPVFVFPSAFSYPCMHSIKWNPPGQPTLVIFPLRNPRPILLPPMKITKPVFTERFFFFSLSLRMLFY